MSETNNTGSDGESNVPPSRSSCNLNATSSVIDAKRKKQYQRKMHNANYLGLEFSGVVIRSFPNHNV